MICMSTVRSESQRNCKKKLQQADKTVLQCDRDYMSYSDFGTINERGDELCQRVLILSQGIGAFSYDEFFSCSHTGLISASEFS